MHTETISQIEILNLRNRYNLVWKNLFPDVNILIGVNGSFKSTMINLVEALFLRNESILKSSGTSVYVTLLEDGAEHKISFEKGKIDHGASKTTLFEKVNTFDTPMRDKSKLRKDFTQLDAELDALIYQRFPDVFSFSDYRLKATDSVDAGIHVNQRIESFFAIVNELFTQTHKVIAIKGSKILFLRGEEEIELNELSSGEKQLLVLLFKVFLMDNEPHILVLDQPEVALHLEWQQQLITVLRRLNPNCQLIVSTHSPGIFAQGWGDRLCFVEDMLIPIS